MIVRNDPSLFAAAQSGDTKALGKLLVENDGLVKKYAKGFSGRLVPSNGCELDDLIQAGRVGLVFAIKGFDPNKGFAFSTYARHWINRYINETLHYNDSLIYVPMDVKIGAVTDNPKFITRLADAKRAKQVYSFNVILDFHDGEDNSTTWDIASGPSPDDEVFFELISQLDDPEVKELVRIKYFEGKNRRSIMDEMDLSEDRYKRVLKRAREAIWKHYFETAN